MTLFNIFSRNSRDKALAQNTFNCVHNLLKPESLQGVTSKYTDAWEPVQQKSSDKPNNSASGLPQPPNPCQKLKKDASSLAMARYLDLESKQKDVMLGKYLSEIGLTNKPQKMSWHHYLKNNCSEKFFVETINKQITEEQHLQQPEKFKVFVRFAVSMYPYVLVELNDELRADKEIVRDAVRKDRFLLEFASRELQNDPDVLMDSMIQGISSLQQESTTLPSDTFIQKFNILRKDIQNNLIKINGYALAKLSQELPANEEIFRVMHEISSLQYKSANLPSDAFFQKFDTPRKDIQNEFNIIRKKIQNNLIKINKIEGQFAIDKAVDQAFKQMLMVVIKRQPMVVNYLSEEELEDKAVLNEAIKYNACAALKNAGPSAQKDPSIVMAAVKRSGGALQYAHSNLKQSYPIVMVAVRKSGTALEYADPSLMLNREIVMAAIKQDPQAYDCIGRGQRGMGNEPYLELRDDRKIRLAVWISWFTKICSSPIPIITKIFNFFTSLFKRLSISFSS